MHRRHFLAGAGIALTTSVGGCLGTDDGLVVGETEGPNSWPKFGYDAANTGFAPGVTGPTDDPEVVWDGLDEPGIPVADDHVYLALEQRNEVVSIEPDGTERWRESFEHDVGRYLALKLYLFVETGSGADRQLHALDQDDGSVAWTVDLPDGWPTPGGPVIGDQRIYLLASHGVVAVDPGEKAIDWEQDFDGQLEREGDWGPLALSRDYVVVPEYDDGAVYFLDRATGTVEGRAVLDASGGWDLYGYPVVGDDHVFVISKEQQTVGASDRLYAVDVEAMEVAWYADLDHRVHWPPAYADGTVFVGHGDGEGAGVQLDAIDVTDRSTHWTYETDSFFNLQPPAVTPEMVYFASGWDVAGIAIADGSEAWQLSLEDREPGGLLPPIVVDETVYVGLVDGKQGLIAIRDGR